MEITKQDKQSVLVTLYNETQLRGNKECFGLCIILYKLYYDQKIISEQQFNYVSNLIDHELKIRELPYGSYLFYVPNKKVRLEWIKQQIKLLQTINIKENEKN